MGKFLWGLAERADWYGWPPKRLWRRLLRHYDRKAGMYEPQEPCDDVQSGPPA